MIRVISPDTNNLHKKSGVLARVKLKFPIENVLFRTSIPVRIGDINYGGHLGNDAVLSIIHETRMQWLSAAGFTELAVGDQGLIMADVMIAYKAEAFYGDVLAVTLFADEVADRSFDLMYRITTERAGGIIEVAQGKTGMVCYDYNQRKTTVVADPLKTLLERFVL